MGELSPLHLVILLVIALIVVGPGKLPELGGALGKTIREFRRASSDSDPASSPAAPAAPVAAASAAAAPIAPVVPATPAAPAAADTATDTATDAGPDEASPAD